MSSLEILNSTVVAPYRHSFHQLTEWEMPFFLKTLIKPITAAQVYRELAFDTKETRMLIIEPGFKGSTIICNLETVSMSRPGAYAALSYCWGPPSAGAQIMINNVRISISVNLDAALQQLRAMGLCRVWVDALSINQHDRRERGLQVRLMKEIYSKASTVVAWLGQSSGRSSLVFEALKETPMSSPVDAVQGHLMDNLVSHTPEILTSSLHDLCERTYWKRMWIIQEIAVAAKVKVLCGSEEVEWDDLINMMGRYEGRKGVLAPGYETHIKPIAMLRNEYQNDDEIGLFHAMGRTRHADATDPRDKIYALLGLCHDGLRLVPFPDYVQPLHEVMRDLSRAMMKSRKSLDFCFLRQSGYLGGNNLPTWALDWVGLWSDPSNIYEADIPQQTRLVLDRSESDDDLLRVSGREVGTINRLCNVSLAPQHGWRLSATNACQRYYASLAGVMEAIQACLCLRFGEDMEKSAKRTFSEFLSNLWLENGTIDTLRSSQIFNHLAEQDRVKLCSPAESRLGISCSGRSRYLLHGQDNPQPPLHISVTTWLEAHALFHVDGRPMIGWWRPSLSKFSLSYLTTRDRRSIRRQREEELILAIARIAHNELRFFVTDEGMIGLADEKAQIGDKICLVRGCSMPAVLRQVNRPHQSTYRFIGEAHAHPCPRDRPLFNSILQNTTSMDMKLQSFAIE